MLKTTKILIALLYLSCIANAQVRYPIPLNDSGYTFENEFVRLSIYELTNTDSNQVQFKLVQPNLDTDKNYLLRINPNNTIDFQYNSGNLTYRSYLQKIEFKNSSLQYQVDGRTIQSTNSPLIDSLLFRTISIGGNSVLKINYYDYQPIAKMYYKGQLITGVIDTLWSQWHQVQICENYFVPKDFSIEVNSTPQTFGEPSTSSKLINLSLKDQYLGNTFITESNINDPIIFYNIFKIYLNLYNYRIFSGNLIWINNHQPKIIKSDQCISNNLVKLSTSNSRGANWYFNDSLIANNDTNIYVSLSGKYSYKQPEIDQNGCKVESVISIEKCELIENKDFTIIKSDSCFSNETVTLTSSNNQYADWYHNDTLISTGTTSINATKEGAYYFQELNPIQPNIIYKSSTVYLKKCDDRNPVLDSTYTFENEFVRLSIIGKFYENGEYKTEVLLPNLNSSKEYLLSISSNYSVNFHYKKNDSTKYKSYVYKVIFKNTSLDYYVDGYWFPKNEQLNASKLNTITANGNIVLSINEYQIGQKLKIYYKGQLIGQRVEYTYNTTHSIKICEKFIVPEYFSFELISEYKPLGDSEQVYQIERLSSLGQQFDSVLIDQNTINDTFNLGSSLTIRLEPLKSFTILVNSDIKNYPNQYYLTECLLNESVKLKTYNGLGADWYSDSLLISKNKTEITANKTGNYIFKQLVTDSSNCANISLTGYINLRNCLNPSIQVFEDLNHNMILDSNEVFIGEAKIISKDATYTTNETGFITISLVDTTQLRKFEVVKNGYYQTSAYRSVYSSYYFYSILEQFGNGFQDTLILPLRKIAPQESYISVINNRFRPGFNTKIFPTVSNKSNSKLSGTIEINAAYPLVPTANSDSLIDSTLYSSFTLPISLNAGESIAYTFEKFKINRFAIVGSTGCYKLILKGFNESNDYIHDSLFVCQEITGSYDPNDISVSPQGLYINNSTLPNTDLDYFVRFQNTGNDTAFTVVIVDTLDAHLEPSSLAMLSASHDYSLDIKNNVVTWTFSNILLPDSNVNNVGSNGYLKFRIKQKRDVSFNTIIQNRVGIYFDFNPVILTNTAKVQIADLNSRINSITDIGEDDILAYPNPAHDYIKVMTKSLADFNLFNLQGEILLNRKIDANSVIDITSIKSGIYYFRVNNQKVQKLVIY